MPDRITTFDYDTDQMRDQASEVAKRAKDLLADTAAKAKEKSAEFERTAINKIDESRGPAASALKTAATKLHDKADGLPGGQTVSGVAHAAADKLGSVADYFQGHDGKQMMSDVERIVKRHPAQSLMVALAVGFLVGRAFRND